MNDWTRLLLYGTYDGFSRSTFGDDNLYLILENGEKVEIPRCFVKNASDFVEKDKLKLKDVIARIKNIDLDSQELWLNEILNKLGSDYGSLKYRAGYEQGKFDCAMERDKVTVPQFVADWIKYCKRTGVNLQRALNMEDLDFYNYANQEDDLKLKEFFETENNQDLFARAWLDGYTIEKERRYTVKMRTTNQPLFYNSLEKKLFFSLGELATQFTFKQLEEAGFGEVFNSPLFEVEEVEDE